MAEISYVVERDLDRCGGSGVIILELRKGALCILVLEKDPSSPKWVGGFGSLLPDACLQVAHELKDWVRKFSHPYNPRKTFRSEIPVRNYWEAWRPDADSTPQMSAESDRSTISLRVETDRNALGLADLFQEMHDRLQGSYYGQ